jgi:hypothetical protein
MPAYALARFRLEVLSARMLLRLQRALVPASAPLRLQGNDQGIVKIKDFCSQFVHNF